MDTPLTPLHDAMTALSEAWSSADVASSLSRRELIAVNDALGLLRRRMDALHAQVAAGIAHESRTELGAESLAKQQGYRSPVQLIAATSGSGSGEAARLVKLGEATAPRVALTGEKRPAKYARLQDALRAGTIGAPDAAVVVALLDRIAPRAGSERVWQAERALVEQAPGLTAEQLSRLLLRVEAWIDPDGVAPREEERRVCRSVTLYERDGMIHLSGKLDAESGAPLKVALEGYVTAQFRARAESVASDTSDADRRSIPMMQADGLAYLAEHALGCAHGEQHLGGARVVVRISMEDLEADNGIATIDGVAAPVSVSVVRRLAAAGSVLPWVCGGDGQVLDLGRERRLSTTAQKMILAERDGGCAMCGLPPGMAKVHHLRWWSRDCGRTDLANGVLLCASCHHRIHDNGWDIRVDGLGMQAKVWFIPSPWIDPAQMPRLGGRARFDLVSHHRTAA